MKPDGEMWHSLKYIIGKKYSVPGKTVENPVKSNSSNS